MRLVLSKFHNCSQATLCFFILDMTVMMEGWKEEDKSIHE